MILFHGYSQDARHEHRQRETRGRLEELQPLLEDRGWTIIDQPLGTALGEDGLSDYERSMIELWGQDDLVVLEHDLVPTLEMLTSMESPSHAICAQAYNLYLDGDSLAAVYQLVSMYERLDETNRKIVDDHGVCVQAYYLWHAAYKPDIHAKNRYIPAIAHRVVEEEPNKHRWAIEGEEWADYYGLGLTRFSREFMLQHPPAWSSGGWQDLDSRISKWTFGLGIKAHIHYPICKHNHVGEDTG